MPRAAHQAHASRSISVASSSSSTQSSSNELDSHRAKAKRELASASRSARKPSTLPPASSEAIQVTRMTTDATEGAAASMPHAPSKGTLTESEKRRQKTLFLGESEQFAFDFGGAVTEIAETVFEADAAQRAAQRVEELEDTTARVHAASASSVTTAPRLLTLEELNAYAAEAMQQGPRRFLTLAKAGSRKRAATTTSSAHAPQDESASVSSAPSGPQRAGDENGATLAEAIPQFQAALRRYEADLWRAHKQRREEDARQRSKNTRSQHA
ncbi:hypothetical protein, conserved [Leishmania donovani]|uniref:Uncharacterized protein n=1 Tax=Leishmania donovani TaxID=5661 RepID=E9BGG5_LEIDO|nr:hypothetical protein, conserved [Leishmania donovani]TPP50212.1 hypothetical protein CGC21_16975 [Leishmania donovani]CBZ34341.1 hypothetical protein, conserved [Leishmania donovani]